MADPEPTSPLPPRTDPLALDYAGFWLRAVAWLIDSALLCIVYGLLFGMPHPWLPTFIVGWVYYALCESSRWQATLGKRALGLIVVDEKFDSLTFKRASGRYLARLASMLTCGIGFILAAFTDRKQALHDLVARTVVLKI